jgi:HlyD family secretion protein
MGEEQPRLAKWKEISSKVPKLPTAVVVGGTIAILGLTAYAFNQIRQASQPTPTETPVVAPVEIGVSAIGRLEPEGEVITVAAPSSVAESKLARLLVEEGDTVSAGQLIAVLDNTDRLSAALDKAQADVKTAEADYADAQAGGKPGDIAAQEAKVASARVELRGQTGIDIATINRLQAQLAGEDKSQSAAIARLEAELTGDNTSQSAAIARLQVELVGESKSQSAKINNLLAQLAGEKKTQAATLARLQAELAGESKSQQATIDRLRNEIIGESQAQQATIDRIKAQVSNAEVEARRYRNLYREGAISASRLDSQELELKTLQEQLTEAGANRRKSITSLEKQVQEAQANRNKTIRSLEEQIQEALANRNKTIRSLEEQIQEALANRNKTLASLEQQIEETSANRSKSNNTISKQIQEAQANRDRTLSTLEQEINEAQANRRKNLGTLQQEIQGSQGTLDAIKNPRATDVQIARAKLQSALANYKQAKADLDAAYVRSPVNGQIFKIQTRAGEKADDDGIVQIGQTERMVVTAEVYESDIEKVKLGQKATIVSDGKAFTGELTGEVSRIALEIGKKDVLSTDPAADVDARVVEVKISLSEADSQKVAGLTNSKVVVKISI